MTNHRATHIGLLTTTEVAALLKISPKTIHNHRANGTGPTILHQATKPFGNRGGLRWTQQQIDKYITNMGPGQA